MERIPQNVAKLVVFRAFLTLDGITPATGKTIAITVSKNGGAFGNPNAGATNATEISSGFYKFTLDTTDTGTVGPLAWRGAQADINDAADIYTVCTDLADHTTLLNDIPTNAELATSQAAADDATLAAIAGLETKVDTVDTVVDAIKAKTDNLPSDPADASVITGRFDTLDTSVADLPTTGEIATAAEIAEAVWQEPIATHSGVAGSTAAAITTIDTVVDAIKVKTDSLTFTVAGQVDANVQAINDVALEGTGEVGDEWGAP